MFPVTDPHTLRQQTYADDEAFFIRRGIHEQYTVPKVDFHQWVLRRIQWHGDERVLDVGCGPGVYSTALAQYQPNVSYYGLDFSPGMLTKHPMRQSVSVGDVQDIPFPAHTFDVVMANHMLYHVPDIDRAIQEFRRVLKPGGVLITATNSIENMPQFRELYKRALLVLTTPGKKITVPLPNSHLFTLESGTRKLANYFYAIVRYDLPGTFVFSEIEPVIAYLESTRSLREPQLPPGISWEAVMAVVREQIKNQLNYVGELIVHKLTGVLVATDRGDFISDFLEHRE
ncbi:MAG: class I SAM-dependent methyltransferase [Anaerolineae bacterium]|nr:class I SAM-dependent methyltransferase [Anaerolineae bacterium]